MRTLITLPLGKLRELATVLVVALALCCAPIVVIVILYAGLVLSAEALDRLLASLPAVILVRPVRVARARAQIMCWQERR
jgi:hypothetical protein